MCDIFHGAIKNGASYCNRGNFVFLRDAPKGAPRAALPSGINEKKPGEAKLQLAELAETVEEEHPELSELSMANFDELITNNPKLVILEVGATWCEPCHYIKPFFRRLQSIFKNEVQIVTLTGGADLKTQNMPANSEYEELEKRLPERHGSAIPWVPFFKDGKLVSERMGGVKIFTDFLHLLKQNGGAVTPEKEREVYRIIAEFDPAKAIENNAELPKAYQEECFRIAAEKNGSAVLEHYEKVKHFDPDKSILKKAAFAAIDFEYRGNIVPHSLPVMDDCAAFVHESFAPDIFKLLMKKELGPGDVLENFAKYAAEPYALEILAIAASYEPANFVAMFPRLREKAPPEKRQAMDLLFEEHVEELMDADPYNFALNARIIIEHQFTNGISNYGLQLLDEMIAKDPENGIRNPNRWDELPDAKARLQSALERTLEVRPGAIFEHFDSIFDYVKLLDEAYEKQVMLQACQRAPRAALENYYRLKEKPYFQKAYKVAFDVADKIDPGVLFEPSPLREAPVILGKEYVSSVLQKHYADFPKEMVKNADAILNLSGGDAAFKTACKTLLDKDPQALIDAEDSVSSLSSAYEFFESMVKKAKKKLAAE